MKKILYLMNVDWNWIKQRPHFIAEGLSDYYEVHVLYKYRYNRKGFQHRKQSVRKNLTISPVFTVPKIDHINKLKRINTLIKKEMVKRAISKIRPEIIYITSPKQVELLPEHHSGAIIYDCMDAHYLFLQDAVEKEMLKYYENKLCKVADGIIVSSNYLGEFLRMTYELPLDVQMSVIRNAFDGNVITINDNTKKRKKDKYKLMYFGTISEWFDFQVLDNGVEGIEYILYGPIHGELSNQKNDNIIFGGTLEHSEIYNAVKDADALIMPFVVDEKIKAVDPVKLYEYINFGKCIVSVRYPEIERFEPFVYFYNTKQEFEELLEDLKAIEFQPKYSDSQRKDFLVNNDWQSRVSDAFEFLETVTSK